MRVEVCRYVDDVEDPEFTEGLLVLSEAEGELFGFKIVLIYNCV